MLVVAGMLALLCAIAVLHPFLRRDPPGDAETDSDNAAGYAELESMLDSIQTLQLEHQIGNIPEDTFREHLQTYRLEAASLLRRIDESRAPDPEQDLERQVLLARLASNGVNGTWLVCAGCGEQLMGHGEACPVCGQSQSTTAAHRTEGARRVEEGEGGEYPFVGLRREAGTTPLDDSEE